MQKSALEKNRVADHSKKDKWAIRKNRVARCFDKKEKIESANRDIFEISFLNRRIIKCN